MNSSFILRSLLCLVGIVLALPVLILIVLAFQLPITISGIGYLLGSSLVAFGFILIPWFGKYSWTVSISGVLVVAVIASVRVISVRQNAEASLKMISLPQGNETRWINSLIDEQDSLIFGEAIFHHIGGDSNEEHKGITSALYADYSEMRSTQNVFPSPFVSTYLNLQQPTHFDAVVIEPDTNQLPAFAVIFLHGYMGNVASQCWEIAKAINGFGATIICPSTDWTGSWWQPRCQAILQETIEYVRGRGIQRFYLGGFSNGGVSINRLASQLKNETGLQGLFFIDGIGDGDSIRETGLPVLVIQGTQDERIPATLAREVVRSIGDSGTYVEFNADHFLIMKQPAQVQNAIMTWLKELESGK